MKMKASSAKKNYFFHLTVAVVVFVVVVNAKLASTCQLHYVNKLEADSFAPSLASDSNTVSDPYDMPLAEDERLSRMLRTMDQVAYNPLYTFTLDNDVSWQDAVNKMLLENDPALVCHTIKQCDHTLLMTTECRNVAADLSHHNHIDDLSQILTNANIAFQKSSSCLPGYILKHSHCERDPLYLFDLLGKDGYGV